MRKLTYALLLICVFNSCHEREISCDEGEGELFEVEDQGGWAFFDERFNTYVIRHHVAGTIDSFRTFVVCNVPDEWQDTERSVLFSGEAQPLKEKYKPSTLIAGESFFVVFLDGVNWDMPQE